MKHLPLLFSGEVLLEDFLKPMGISSYRLAKDIGVSLSRISSIINGKRGITADTGLRLDRYFGLTEGYWLRVQLACDIRAAKRRIARELDHITPREAIAA
jgi:addiction module HigA family antidote